MKNPLTMLKRSAQPENMKVSTVSSEILRRLKNTSEHVGKELNEKILTRYMDELSAMEYSSLWREKMLESTVRGYMKILRKVEDGETDRHRAGYKTSRHRRYKRLCGISEWYEDREIQHGDDDDYDAFHIHERRRKRENRQMD